MSNPAAISGSFADYRLVKSRGVLQIIVEIPVERQGEAFAALGYPVPGTDIPVALARLVAPSGRHVEQASPSRSEQAKSRYASSSERERAVVRAASYPKDEKFRQWVSIREGAGNIPVGSEYAVKFIRDECGVNSRAEILTSDRAYRRFLTLETDYRKHAGLMPEVR